MTAKWTSFRILMHSETHFDIQGAESPEGPWTKVYETPRWSSAITVYRKMVDLNWRWE